MSRRTWMSIVLGVTSVACAVGAFDPASSANHSVTALPDPEQNGNLGGIVRDQQTQEGIDGAIVILQCSCLDEVQERQTNAQGVYQFRDLPSGTYTVQILSGQSDVSHVVTVQKGRQVRLTTRLGPSEGIVVT